MGIKDQLFKWFKSNDKDGLEINLGYVLDGEPKTTEDIKKVFKAFDLESKFEIFKPLIRSKIDFELVPSNDDQIKIGQSKVGGKPDLLSSSEWPMTNTNKNLSFIGQLNCAELKTFDNDSLLPSNGLISFFTALTKKLGDLTQKILIDLE